MAEEVLARVMLMVDWLPTFTVCEVYPIELNWSWTLDRSGTEMLYNPSRLVWVVVLVPLTETFTPWMPCLELSDSTRPVTWRLCAEANAMKRRVKRESKIVLFI